ncbi:SusD/RagB family nutrient-binding outer membrane lipoprotein [Chitinophaga sp. Mgbs1]|uniref:SusD/RagB family nutrient-binding outer membrane lipoprotein n=1 Tax=Chitinophaga solisilvae TaxID=1233460 RepID=A0A3S1D2I7_9BACT|nr:SusD/RagB family nutrient-binding outer membrane lipoprotein [Chitinophaga solisilvae]
MKRASYIFLVTLAAMAGCTKGFLDINTDPNNPTKVTLNQLLPASEQGLGYAMGFTNDARGARGLTEVLSVYMHQVTVRESQDQYGATGSQFDINNSWSDFYSAQSAQPTPDYIGVLENLQVLIDEARAGNNYIYTAIGRILKAYGVSQFVDAFADVPYSEANKFASAGIRYPKFDKGQDIYPQLLVQLDSAIGELQATGGNSLKPAADDVFYGGDPDLWIKAANSIKLKLYNQIRLTTNVSAKVNELISGGNLISSLEEGFMIRYRSGTSPDDRNPGYSEYYATQKSHYQSPWFYEILKGLNKRLFTGIRDPRIPYYFFNQNKPLTAAQNGTDYRDSAFISILFGSVGPNRDKSQDNSMTVFGIYPVGGRYDDRNALVVNGGSGTGAAPLRLLTYADVLYIKAELQNAGIVAGDARATLQQALDASFAQVDFVVNLAKGSQNIPALAGTASATGYINSIMAYYDSRPTAAAKLEVIMTEKWIQSFGFSGDQYSDYRRTGYPVLFDPNNAAQAPGGFFQPPLTGDPSLGGPQPAVKVILGRRYPLSLPWPTNELNVNPNAPAQKAPDTSPVFWDK